MPKLKGATAQWHAGVLEARLVYDGRSHAELCEGGSANVSACTFDIQLPVDKSKFQPGHAVRCTLLEPYPPGQSIVTKPVNLDRWTVFPLTSETPDVVVCSVTKLGKPRASLIG